MSIGLSVKRTRGLPLAVMLVTAVFGVNCASTTEATKGSQESALLNQKAALFNQKVALLNQKAGLPSKPHASPLGWLQEAMVSKIGRLVSNVDQAWRNNVSKQCASDVDEFTWGVVTLTGWAYTMFDAWGLQGSGTVEGNIKWNGAYGQCVRTQSEGTETVIKGKHCMAQITYGVSFDYGFGVCVPHTCSANEVKVILKANLTIIPFPEGAEVWCTEPISLASRPAAIAFLCFMGIFCLVAVAATAFDLWRRKQQERLNVEKTNPEPKATRNGHVNQVCNEVPFAKEIEAPYQNVSPNQTVAITANGSPIEPGVTPLKTFSGATEANLESSTNQASLETRIDQPKSKGKQLLEKVFVGFSLYKNANGILDANHPPGSLTSLTGIRFLSFAWIVLGHTWVLGISIARIRTMANPAVFGRLSRSFMHGTIHRMNLGVEAFFLMSGMLVTISFLKAMKRMNGSIIETLKSLPCFYFHRYWRLTPAYAMLIWYSAEIYPLIGLGPQRYHSDDQDTCKTTWWSNLIYLNNLISVYDHRCMGWSWYLCCDFQYYILSPIVLIPLFKKRIVGFVLLGLGMTWTLIENIVRRYFMEFRQEGDWYSEIYVIPSTRMGPYIMGICLGYIYYQNKFKVKIPKWAVVVGWILAVGVITVVVFVPYSEACEGCPSWTQAGKTAFWALHRNIFSLGLVWIVFACCGGYGGFINSFLSSTLFVPVSKLTFLGYLIHPLFIYFTYYQMEVPFFMSKWIMLFYFIGFTVLSLVASFGLSVLVELPMLNIESVLLRRKKK